MTMIECIESRRARASNCASTSADIDYLLRIVKLLTKERDQRERKVSELVDMIGSQVAGIVAGDQYRTSLRLGGAIEPQKRDVSDDTFEMSLRSMLTWMGPGPSPEIQFKVRRTEDLGYGRVKITADASDGSEYQVVLTALQARHTKPKAKSTASEDASE